MRPGHVIAGRFEIEARAGEGGIGVVMRARDRQSGRAVAVKLLKSKSSQTEQRFAREAAVLRELDHPAIVSYVAHGSDDQGRMFLVMDWLDGETLEERLARQGLSVQESIDLIRRVAAALGQAHRRGIVHRDLKPANLFLVDKRLDDVRVLDFGVARVQAETSLTRTGIPVGTPSYMAPEQARGITEPDACADVFSLGAVLYECLTGQQAFPGDDALSVLARVIFEPAPRVREVRPDLPEQIESLLAIMLAKNPALRLRDAEAVAHALDVVEDHGLPGPAPVATRAAVLTHHERALTTLVVLADDTAFDDKTLPEAEVASQAALCQSVAEFYGARFEFALGRKLLIFSGHDAPVDQAAQAARAALELSQRLAAPVCIVTGFAVSAAHVPVGEVLERALSLSLSLSGERGVHVDEVSAGLLATRFALSDDRRRVFQERGLDEPARMLLGRLTPCVGRERELKLLEAIAGECARGPIASAVLVTGAAGVGKSRLRDEFLVRLAGSGLDYEIWSARGEAMKRGFALELLRSIVRAVDAPARAHSLLPPIDGARVSAVLGRLLGGTADRNQAGSLDALRLAWLDFVDAVSDRAPVLLVIDDAHLADAASLSLIDAALERLEERPLFVLAFGRRELSEAFPKLWAERAPQEIRLPEITKRASEELVRAVLGGEATDERIARIVEHAGGNAFVLEELIRTTSQESSAGLPRSAIAVAQARLGRVDPEARRVLKAASVFGDSFWPDALASSLGGPLGAEVLASLEARELVERRAETRFAGCTEYGFRHALLREAAYALLTDEDRAVAHRLAAEWLAAHAETNAAAVAEHFELGGDRRRAIPFWRRAAEQALAADDFSLAIERAEHGIGAGAHGALLGELSVTLGEAARWTGDLERADSALREARALLQPGSRLWCVAAREHAVVLQRSGRRQAAALLGRELAASEPASDAELELALARLRVTMTLALFGETELAARLRQIHDQLTPAHVRELPVVAALEHRNRADAAGRLGDFAEFLASTERAVECFRRAGLERQAVSEQVTVGYALFELGAYERAREALATAEAAAARLGLAQPAAVARQNLGIVLSRLGRLDEAERVERAALETFVALGERRMQGGSHTYLALILDQMGDHAAARAEAERAIELLSEAAPPLVPEASAALASILLRQNDADGALARATAAHDQLEAGNLESGEALVRLAYCEALWASGLRERSLAALARAAERLAERAAAIGDETLRASFLERVAENRRTLELARERLGG